MRAAERLAQHVGAAGVTPRDNLGPNDPVPAVAELLATGEADLAIVGHMPHVQKLASLLLTRDEDARAVTFENSGIVCLERTEARSWSVRWMVVPSLLG